MSSRIRILLVTAVGCMLMATATQAQIVKKAQVGFRFLENPVGAEVVGRGGVGVATTLSSNAIFWNPALLAWVMNPVDLSLNHTTWIADISYNAAAVSIQLGNLGVLGLDVFMMDYGTFYGTRRADNEQGYIETGTFSPKAYAIGAAFAQRVSDRFSYGVHLKYVRQDLGNAWVAPTGTNIGDPNLPLEARSYAQSGYALDVGAYYDFLYNGIRFGATLQNISREIRYESEPFPMPFAVSFGATLEPIHFFSETGGSDLVLSFESKHPRDFNEKLKMGAEYRIFGAVVARLGYMLNYDERGLTAGLGFRYEMGGLPLRADYGYQAFGLFGAVHHLSIGISY